MRLHRIGECRAQMVLVTFAETKVTRAKRGSSALESNKLKRSRSFAALRMTKIPAQRSHPTSFNRIPGLIEYGERRPLALPSSAASSQFLRRAIEWMVSPRLTS